MIRRTTTWLMTTLSLLLCLVSGLQCYVLVLNNRVQVQQWPDFRVVVDNSPYIYCGSIGGQCCLYYHYPVISSREAEEKLRVHCVNGFPSKIQGE